MDRKATNLDEFLTDQLAIRWRWGETDCCCFAGDWVLAATGIDPMEPYRGKYNSWASAVVLFESLGGLKEAVSDRMDRIGFKRRQYPDHGDVGIISVPAAGLNGETAMRDVAAIFYATRWHCRSETGLVGGNFSASRVWHIG